MNPSDQAELMAALQLTRNADNADTRHQLEIDLAEQRLIALEAERTASEQREELADTSIATSVQMRGSTEDQRTAAEQRLIESDQLLIAVEALRTAAEQRVIALEAHRTALELRMEQDDIFMATFFQMLLRSTEADRTEEH